MKKVWQVAYTDQMIGFANHEEAVKGALKMLRDPKNFSPTFEVREFDVEADVPIGPTLEVYEGDL